MRASRSDSALISECAAQAGVSIRAVQQWRKKDDARWREFLRRRAQEAAVGEQLGLGSAVAQPVSMTPEQEEESAAKRYAYFDALVESAARRGDLTGMPALLKSAQEMHKLLTSVRDNNMKLAVATNAAVPTEKVREYIGGSLAMAKHLIEALPDVLASRIESSQDVAALVRSEVEVILKELSVAAASAPWNKPSADDRSANS